MEPKWNILIATLGQRKDKFKRLIDILMPQVDKYDGEVIVTALWNNGEHSLSHVRQSLMESSRGEYTSFIDDDDILPHYFVDEVMERLDGVDYIGWRMQAYSDGYPLKPTFHSLRYDHWWDDANGYYRDISHLNPVRRQLALQADFRRTTPPEDVAWCDQMRGLVLTEHYIDRVMYEYYASSTDSTWAPGAVTRPTRGFYSKLDVFSQNFSYHPRSSE